MRLRNYRFISSSTKTHWHVTEAAAHRRLSLDSRSAFVALQSDIGLYLSNLNYVFQMLLSCPRKPQHVVCVWQKATAIIYSRRWKNMNMGLRYRNVSNLCS